MRRSTRFRLSVLAVFLTTAAMLASTGGARAVAPTSFPAGFGLDATAFTLRFAGTDRFATAGTGALVAAVNQDKTSGWPYNSGNPGDAVKAYGAAACPKTVFIVASDGLPDALAASPLRGIANVTLTGSTHVYDTSNALLLLTDTARPPVNATHLNANTKTALTALKQACTSGFDALILGGTAAVPGGAHTDLDAYANAVDRIAGFDRYDTAGQIAELVSGRVGLGSPTYYSSASDAGTAEAGSVFLAEGLTGADALAVGPIAADTHTPIVLTDSAVLPTATTTALGSLRPSHIILLGGTAAIPDAVASAAKTAAGTPNAPIRIAGPNRYATSVDLAENLDDIWAANAKDQLGNDTNAFSNQLFGFARSEGSGADHVGWPDALSSALVLESIFAGKATAPTRVAPPVETNALTTGTTMIGGSTPPKRVPLLLLTQAAAPPEVQSFLTGLYPFAVPHTTMAPTGNTVDDGGFGFVFGGAAAVGATTELTLAQDLSGGAYTQGASRSDLSPALDASKVFYTSADLTNYASPDGGMFKSTSDALGAGDKLCVARATATGIQWLDSGDAGGLDLADGGPSTLAFEPAGATYKAGQNVPFCVSVASLSGKSGGIVGVSLSGQLSAGVLRDWSSPSFVLTTSTPGTAASPSFASQSPAIGSIDQNASPTGPTTLTLTYKDMAIPVVYRGQSYGFGTLNVTLTRTNTSTQSQANTADSIICAGTFTATSAAGGSPAFTATFSGAESPTAPSGPQAGTSGTIMCVGEYTIGSATGAIHFAIKGDNNPAPIGAPAALSDLIVNGNA